MTDRKCVIDGLTDTDKDTQQHLACSCADNTSGTDLRRANKPGDSAQSGSFPNNMTSAQHSQRSLKMNSSSWYQRTDYISPNRRDRVSGHIQAVYVNEGLGSDTSCREEIRRAKHKEY